MTTWHGRMLATVGWLILAASAAAAPPTEKELREWLAGLDAESYAAREEASQRLVAAGEAAIDFLADGVHSSSPEAAWRASAALARIALAGDETILNRVTSALGRLSQNGRPGLSKLAEELHARQAKLRHDRAVAKVRSLGGRFSGEGEELVAFGGGFFGGMPAFVEVVEDVVLEKVAGDVKMLVEVGEPVADKPAAEPPALEIPANIKAFDEALERAAARPKPAPPAAVEVPAPPQAAEVPAPPPDIEVVPAADGIAPPAVEAIGVAAGEIFFADAIGIDVGFAFGGDEVFGSGEEQPSESLALDANWKGGDDGLAALRDLPNIVALSITDAKLSDAALVHLALLPRLENLELHGTMFTAAGLHKYRQQRPATRIFARGNAMLGVNADTEGPCVLSSVYYGSGAYEAGLVQGDEIVKVDGLKVADFSDLTIAVFTHQPSEKLQVEFKRDGQLKAVSVVLKDRRAVEAGSR